MEIKIKKWMFALILLVLTLISAVSVVARDGLLYRLSQSNIGLYFGGKMLANYFIVFAILFIIIYWVLFSKEKRPETGVLLYFFLAALFIVSVFITVLITRGAIAQGQTVFIWELSKLAGVKWLFKAKTIVNALIIAGICLVVKTYAFKEKGKEKEGKIAVWFIVILISLLGVSMINYSAVQPKGVAADKYDSSTKYIDRWVWEFPQVSKIKLFLLGADPNGSYQNEKGEVRQGILKFGEEGKGLPAFFLGSLLLIWLFIHFEIFKKGGGKFFQYGIPILLAALLANEGYTKEVVMSYAWWTALIVINNSFKKSWGKDRPGMAFGLAFAIVQTTYRAIVGTPYMSIGTDSFAWNFFIGIGVGFIWDLLLGKGGIWDAQAKRTENLKNTIGDLWEKDRVKAVRYGLGELGNALFGGLPMRWKWFRKFMGEYTPLEEEVLKLENIAETIIRELIKEDEKPEPPTPPPTPIPKKFRNPDEVTRLRREFNTQIMRIEQMNIRIARLRGREEGGGT